MKLDHRICDRCGIEFEESLETTYLHYEVKDRIMSNWYKAKEQSDLCSFCTGEFKKFMSERNPSKK